MIGDRVGNISIGSMVGAISIGVNTASGITYGDNFGGISGTGLKNVLDYTYNDVINYFYSAERFRKTPSY